MCIKSIRIKLIAVAAVMLTVACGGSPPATTTGEEAVPAAGEPEAPAEAETSQAQTMTQAVAELAPTEGNSVTGVVRFALENGNVHVTATVEGLTPGKHGFHIHEKGDCSAPDGTSAGGHFNPDMMNHGGPMADMRHVGDLGNLDANEQGVATLDFVDSHMSFDGPNSIVGRGVIVHADEDDLTSQPTGAAGARVACGVIQLK